MEREMEASMDASKVMTKYEGNPIISPRDMPFDFDAVHNGQGPTPAANTLAIFKAIKESKS